MKALLFILVCFIALTSTLSGLLMIIRPDGGILSLPVGLLGGTPFKDFLVPGILLTTVVGSVNLVAGFYNLKRHTNRYNWAIAGGVMICGWIIAQMILIRAFHWLHIIYLVIGILIILIAYQCKGKWAV
jgi:hypothetical protein